jgi:enoyl-CoA hydratase/carnithine racemase
VSVGARVEGRIGHVVLDRPEAMNAITIDLARELERAVRETAAEADVVVVRGAGGNFSVGGDFKALEELRAHGPAALAELFDAFGSACAAVGAVSYTI